MSIVNCAKFGGYMNLYENVKAIAKETMEQKKNIPLTKSNLQLLVC